MKTALRSSRAIGKASQQHGIVLIDAMVAILIFSVGILGMVALQGSAVEMTTGSSYRINAAMLADQVIAQMWASDLTALQTNFQSSVAKNGSSQGGSGYTNWFNSMDCTVTAHVYNCLPGVKANPPSIVVTPQTIANGNTEYQVTVTVSWQAPSDSSAHKYVSVTAIGN